MADHRNDCPHCGCSIWPDEWREHIAKCAPVVEPEPCDCKPNMSGYTIHDHPIVDGCTHKGPCTDRCEPEQPTCRCTNYRDGHLHQRGPGCERDKTTNPACSSLGCGGHLGHDGICPIGIPGDVSLTTICGSPAGEVASGSEGVSVVRDDAWAVVTTTFGDRRATARIPWRSFAALVSEVGR